MMCKLLGPIDEEPLQPRRLRLVIEDATSTSTTTTAVVSRAAPRPGWPVSGLALELAAVRSVHAPGQPIELRARLLNVGVRELIVLRRASNLDLQLRICDPAGRPLAWLEPAVPPPRPTRQELVALPPGAALPLAPWEELAQLNRRVVEGRLRTGQFLVTAIYRTDSGLCEPRRLDPRAWVGAVVANQLLLTVSEVPAPIDAVRTTVRELTEEARLEEACTQEVRLPRGRSTRPARSALAPLASGPCGVRALFHSRPSRR